MQNATWFGPRGIALASEMFHVFGFFASWFMLGTFLLTRRMSKMTPNAKAVFVVRHPKIAGFVDLLSGFGINASQIRRGAELIAKGTKSATVLAVLATLGDDEADGITLTTSLAPMKLIDLPHSTAYPPPMPDVPRNADFGSRYSFVGDELTAPRAPAVALPEQPVEPFSVVRSGFPPAVDPTTPKGSHEK